MLETENPMAPATVLSHGHIRVLGRFWRLSLLAQGKSAKTVETYISRPACSPSSWRPKECQPTRGSDRRPRVLPAGGEDDRERSRAALPRAEGRPSELRIQDFRGRTHHGLSCAVPSRPPTLRSVRRARLRRRPRTPTAVRRSRGDSDGSSRQGRTPRPPFRRSTTESSTHGSRRKPGAR